MSDSAGTREGLESVVGLGPLSGLALLLPGERGLCSLDHSFLVRGSYHQINVRVFIPLCTINFIFELILLLEHPFQQGQSEHCIGLD